MGKRSEISLRSRYLTPSDIALRLFQGKADLINHVEAAAWLGDNTPDRSDIRKAYMRLFDWTNSSVLASLRSLCDKLYMKAESQQLDRIIDSFSDRWCECNPRHGFKSPGVIYTLAYSILLLNTDHHSEEFTSAKKMPRSQYVQQTFETMRSLLKGEGMMADDNNSILSRKRTSIDSLSRRPSSMKRWSTTVASTKVDNTTLVCDDSHYTVKEWESLIMSLLKGIYTSIDLTPLNLARGSNNCPPRVYLHAQSSATSLNNYYGAPSNSSDVYNRGALMSRLSLNRRSSWISSSDAWSDYEYQGIIANNQPIMGDRRSMYIKADEPIGFSGVLRNSIIREERAAAKAGILGHSDLASIGRDSLGILGTANEEDEDDASSSSVVSSKELRRGRSPGGQSSPNTSQEDSSDEPTTVITINDFGEETEDEDVAFEEKLELTGAPWAKEGLLKFQAFVNGGISKKYRKREGWLQVFVIVQKGYLKIFRFDHPSRNERPINYTFDPPNAYSNVGGGNWLDRATLTDNIPLCQTMAQAIPVTNMSAGMKNSIIISSSAYMSMLEPDHVDWSLTLPNKSVLVFRAGTKEIADEYVYTCNYWAARSSKEPLVEAVSSSEYGWNYPLEKVAEKRKEDAHYKPLVQSGAYDAIVIDGQKIQIREWRSPLVSQVLSNLDESNQLEMLKRFNTAVEKHLEDHNASRAEMIQLFQSALLVSARAHSNWERKSQYLLKETVKYGMYISTLEKAMEQRRDLELKAKSMTV
ncbi:hypothetical protein AWJ20_3273 [Sugiyamaella lignohabitans]|uniref:SEC7 domain-containing protein n=1 Tax=Sugiyamaella lignohabitans TaxID=796027 RepID=A0A167FS84_9ASCO|nr:uncharacterized protein AWJ20_3273 [Sugiyamaella lignohabitans]ANB15636.1 hypothetical protein AWJ20_3273 [Sugiyamaella lignohabitans]